MINTQKGEEQKRVNNIGILLTVIHLIKTKLIRLKDHNS